MNIEEIFSLLLSHAFKGVLIHNQIASAFGFLNLRGYQAEHEYHFYEESENYRSIYNFFLLHYSKLIKENIEIPSIIPDNWYKYSKKDVDANNKRSAIKDLMKEWVDWEQNTKNFLQEQYKQLYELGEIDGAIRVMEWIKEVSEELAFAREQYINLESIGYDIVYIVDQQQSLFEKYHKKFQEDDD